MIATAGFKIKLFEILKKLLEITIANNTASTIPPPMIAAYVKALRRDLYSCARLKKNAKVKTPKNSIASNCHRFEASTAVSAGRSTLVSPAIRKALTMTRPSQAPTT